MDIFHRLHDEQGKTIVLITHSKELAAETQRIVTISDGYILTDEKNDFFKMRRDSRRMDPDADKMHYDTTDNYDSEGGNVNEL